MEDNPIMSHKLKEKIMEVCSFSHCLQIQADFLKHIHKGEAYALRSIPETSLTQKELSYIVLSRLI